MSNVFHRAREPIVAARAEGSWVYDVSGNAYLDAAGGALVNNIGHGVREVIDAVAGAMAQVDYVHPSVFTSEPLESYARSLATLLPIADLRVYPTNGGSEAMETALKLARAYHLARGEPQRDVVLSRRMSYHGNTLGALDVSGRQPLRRPYEPWLNRFAKVPEVNEYRCPSPAHPDACGAWHIEELESAIDEAGSHRVAAFVAEPIGGATLGATIPPDGYWPGVAEVCARHGVLLVVDEVMTGFGRTGRWFGIEHFGVSPDIMVMAKGAASGYWPVGLCVASGSIFEMVGDGFVHGFTYSHSPTGAAVAHAVLDRIVGDDLVNAAEKKGELLLHDLQSRLGEHPLVGDVRGLGLMIGVEFVSNKEGKVPFPRSDRFVERLTQACRERGLLLYPSTGCANGTDGDLVMIGPPFIVSEEEMDLIGERLLAGLETVR